MTATACIKPAAAHRREQRALLTAPSSRPRKTLIYAPPRSGFLLILLIFLDSGLRQNDDRGLFQRFPKS